MGGSVARLPLWSNPNMKKEEETVGEHREILSELKGP